MFVVSSPLFRRQALSSRRALMRGGGSGKMLVRPCRVEPPIGDCCIRHGGVTRMAGERFVLNCTISLAGPEPKRFEQHVPVSTQITRCSSVLDALSTLFGSNSAGMESWSWSPLLSVVIWDLLGPSSASSTSSPAGEPNLFDHRVRHANPSNRLYPDPLGMTSQSHGMPFAHLRVPQSAAGHQNAARGHRR